MAGTGCDWVEILEPRSRERMYVNLASGECGWNPPAGAPVRQADGNQWWELFDPQSARFYYYNSTGRRTVWHRPQGADIVPLSQLQAMKRRSEAERAGAGADAEGHPHGSVGSPGALPPERDGDGDDPESAQAASEPAADVASRADGCGEERREPYGNASQRWQPTPGSKAAMLVKVNSMSRKQPLLQPGALDKATFSQQPSGTKAQGGCFSSGRGYKTAPCEPRQAHHARKASDGSFCAAAASDSRQASPLLGRSQSGTPRPLSPQYACGAPPIYDQPLTDCPVYDEPPVDMEVEGAHLFNGRRWSGPNPSQSLQRARLLGHPAASVPGSRHGRAPCASDYSPAGLECIKHMINVDPKQLLSGSPVATRGPSPTCRQGLAPNPPARSQAHSLPHVGSPSRAGEAGAPAPGAPDKKQSWRVLEATVQRAMEARHSRQSSQASQDFAPSTPQATANYQDSGYSTGPSPGLRRKSRRRTGAAAARPGSVGSGGELCALNERLMAEMREVVGRSNTVREARAGPDQETGRQARSPVEPRRWRGGGGPPAADRSSREDLAGAADAPLEIPARQKRTYEKVDTLDMSLPGRAGPSSPETPGPPSQASTLELRSQPESGKKDAADGRAASLGPRRPAGRESGEGAEGAESPYRLSYASLRRAAPPAEVGIEDWASKHLNMHTQGLFRRRVSIANMLSWNRGSIKKPMLVTGDRAVRKEACEMFKLVQAYMGDRPSRLDRRHCALLVVTKCWDTQGLRDELYVQLVRQTTGNASPRSLAAGWELMAVSLAFFAPSPKFRCYLEGYIQRHVEPASDKKCESQSRRQVTQFILEQQEMKLKKNSKSMKKRKQNTDEEEGLPVSTYAKFCHRKLQKVAITGGKKGLRKPTLEEVDHSRRAIVTPSLFGSSLEEVMERQSELFPDRKLPWVQVQLSQYVLALGGAQTEGIFRVPGDIDEVNALKLQVDQWRIPENLSDPNVPASLMKLWYRELEEPLIPMNFYKQCVSNCDDPVAAIAVVQSLPELSRLVLFYFIHFLQVFAQPSNVAITKMDVNNLAMVMAPNCLRCQSDDPRIIFENTRKEMSFLRMLIVHLDTSYVEGVV
ncbi:rho GTPase-activating protein 39 isoform X2 [Hippocampus zosterae]|uniref:rho GTPase-activating protein 39 isoform X2 n=1 Tax=Hippocampus zosterae TaxID=109293 RepID=UPI00223E7E99|nr:rho GTPase-activating protein 39 isoform X2 [Hippocampus zosterae]